MVFLPGLDLEKIKDGVSSGVKMAQDGLAAGVRSAQEGIANVNVDAIAEGAKSGIAFGVSAVSEVVEGLVPKENDADDEHQDYREFIAILWYLAQVDGIVSDEEKKALEQLALSVDEGYGRYAEELEAECASSLEVSAKEFGLSAGAKIEAQKIIETLQLSHVEAKLLCWNLLALANSDGMSGGEFDFIRFVSEIAGVSRSVFEELRNYSDAVVEIGSARERLRKSNRGYADVESLVVEYEKRERAVLEAAQALVEDR